ncbi:MAG: intermembrane phospholipid transport protein YdbH family protein, partial [Pseudomonadota bacterium]
AERAILEGEMRLEGREGTWSVVAAPGLTLTLDASATPGAVGFTVQEGRISQGGSGVSAALDATAGAFDARLATGDGAIALEDVEGRVIAEFDAAMRGEVRLLEGAARAPELSLAVSQVTGTLASRGMASPADLSLSSRLRDTGPASQFSPLELTLAGTLDGEAVALSGTAAGAGGVSLPVEVTADLGAGAAEARVGPGRVRFRPGGLQPAAFSPRFAALRDVGGSVEVDGSLSKPAGGAASTRLRLRLYDLSASAGDAGAEGLSGELVFSSLSPLVSAGVQRLSARRLIAGVPLSDADLRFSVVPGRGGASIRIRRATAGLAGGEVVLSDATWNTDAAVNAAEVAVRDVSIERLLRDWRIEGVGGTGRLSGMIPIRVGRNGISVEGGRLEADGPGVVRVNWGGARETLVGAGEQAELAVRALEDFRYEALSMGVDQAPGEALTLSVRLEGANPEVLDGHPFRFNVNLSGRLEPILEAVRQGRRIGADLIRGGLGGAR